VIADCYNANPDSMQAAVEFLESVPWEGRRIAVLGGMRELGDETTPAHEAVGKRLRGTPLDAVFLFGAEMEHAWKYADDDASSALVAWTDRMETLSERVVAYVHPGDLVLLKGSRGLELERLLPVLTGGAAGAEEEGPRC